MTRFDAITNQGTSTAMQCTALHLKTFETSTNIAFASQITIGGVHGVGYMVEKQGIILVNILVSNSLWLHR